MAAPLDCTQLLVPMHSATSSFLLPVPRHLVTSSFLLLVVINALVPSSDGLVASSDAPATGSFLLLGFFHNSLFMSIPRVQVPAWRPSIETIGDPPCASLLALFLSSCQLECTSWKLQGEQTDLCCPVAHLRQARDHIPVITSTRDTPRSSYAGAWGPQCRKIPRIWRVFSGGQGDMQDIEHSTSCKQFVCSKILAEKNTRQDDIRY